MDQRCRRCPPANFTFLAGWALLARLDVLPYGAEAAQHYGAIRAALEKICQTIGVNDLHIAGHARSKGLVLVTNNTSEFVRVPALEVENWVQLSQ